jgi:hypothetical protein
MNRVSGVMGPSQSTRSRMTASKAAHTSEVRIVAPVRAFTFGGRDTSQFADCPVASW